MVHPFPVSNRFPLAQPNLLPTITLYAILPPPPQQKFAPRYPSAAPGQPPAAYLRRSGKPFIGLIVCLPRRSPGAPSSPPRLRLSSRPRTCLGVARRAETEAGGHVPYRGTCRGGERRRDLTVAARKTQTSAGRSAFGARQPALAPSPTLQDRPTAVRLHPRAKTVSFPVLALREFASRNAHRRLLRLSRCAEIGSAWLATERRNPKPE